MATPYKMVISNQSIRNCYRYLNKFKKNLSPTLLLLLAIQAAICRRAKRLATILLTDDDRYVRPPYQMNVADCECRYYHDQSVNFFAPLGRLLCLYSLVLAVPDGRVPISSGYFHRPMHVG